MALFGRRPVGATVIARSWSRTVTLESQRWVPRQSSRVPSVNVRNVVKRAGAFAAPVAGPQQPGLPAGSGIPGPTVGGVPTEVRPTFYYTYEELEWGQGRVLAVSGDGPDDVRWPQEVLGAGERVKSRSESYTLALDASGQQHEASLPEPEWRALPAGSAVRLTLGLLGGVKTVTPDHG
jgi:hypothetical protein